MAKQDKEAQPVVPADAVGQVTIETKETDGDVTVKTAPAAKTAAKTAPIPPAKPADARAARQRAARQRTMPARTPRARKAPAPRAETVARTVTIELTEAQWNALDRQTRRSGLDEAAWLQRLLAPRLRS